MSRKEIVIIGGGLGGLVSGILLNRAGFKVRLFEKKKYPFHRVCGEYISNETKPFLTEAGLFPKQLNPSTITRFLLSSTSGRTAELPLEMGGFGVSRFAYDKWLADLAITEGVEVLQGQQIRELEYSSGGFKISTAAETFEAPLVIGAFGKRSKLDKNLGRNFISQRSPFVAVKYHVKADFPNDMIALHNFAGGYCGISKIENDTYNLCYLSRRENLRTLGDIPTMEQAVLVKNPLLKEIFENSDFLLDTPEVINEISFARKELIQNHVLMVGDSAGLITPLCGNGMAMALHGAKVLSDIITANWKSHLDRFNIELQYVKSWNNLFRRRLWIGRKTQHLFGGAMSEAAITLGNYVPPLAKGMVRMTHGREF